MAGLFLSGPLACSLFVLAWPRGAALGQDDIPQSLQARIRLANALYDQGNLVAALAEYRRVYAESGKTPALFNIGKICAALNRPVESVAELNKLLASPGITPPDRLARKAPPAHRAHLLKACHYWTDTAQGDFELFFVRDKEGREVDFLVVRDGRPFWLVECTSSDTQPSPSLLHFMARLGGARAFQLVSKPGYDRVHAQDGLRVLDYERFLAGLV